jgi:hypothetical protein
MIKPPAQSHSISKSPKKGQEEGKAARPALRKDLQKLESEAHRLFVSIPSLPPGDLTPAIKLAQRLGGYAFLIRGACATTFLAANNIQPLPGGRGRIDAEGKGRRAHFRQLATVAGVSRKTLETDARIYETFFKEGVDSKTGDARFLTLSRELFVVALAAPDPWVAVQVALEHAGEPGYGRRQLRQHIRELLEQSGSTPPLARKRTPTRWTMTPEAKRVLAELQELSSREPAVIITEALLRYRKTMKRSCGPENSGRTSDAATPNGGAALDDSTGSTSHSRASHHESGPLLPAQPTLFPPTC